MTAALPTTPDFFCTDVSINFNERQMGTAVFATAWFILEVQNAWHPKAPATNDLPQPVQAWLHAQVGGVANGRIQFIRRSTNETDSLAFFIANTSEQDPTLYRFELNSYDDLFRVDMTAVLANDPTYAAHQWHDPLVLVCTHGRRDRCCARFGLPVYNALRAEMGDAVWQTTHLGGHRFAPTLLTFPVGVSYGRLTTADIPQLVQSLPDRRLLLQKLRGRCCYPSIAQVADYFLRQETGQTHLDSFHHLSTQADTDSRWTVTFTRPSTNQTHHLTIEEDAEPLQLYASSGSFKIKSVPQYHLITHEAG